MKYFPQKLILANNQLSYMPGTIWGHEHLVNLDLVINFLGIIHSDIEKAKTLQTLYLSNNTLTWLPKEIGNTNLIWLSSTIDSNSSEIYKYLNFDQVPSFVESASNVEISEEMLEAARKLKGKML